MTTGVSNGDLHLAPIFERGKEGISTVDIPLFEPLDRHGRPGIPVYQIGTAAVEGVIDKVRTAIER